METIKVFLVFLLLIVVPIFSQTSYEVIGLCGTTGALQVRSYGINDSSYIVGDIITEMEGIAYCYKDGLYINLGNLGYASAYAYAINIHGNIVGSSLLDVMGPWHAFLYTNGNMTDIGTFSGDRDSYATGINKNNTVVGYYDGETLGERFGFIYNGSITTFGNPGSITQAWSINDSGYVVGNTEGHAFILGNGAMQNLAFDVALDINNKNQVVGWLSGHAILYDNGVVTDLGPGYTYAINDSGLIVGYTPSLGGRGMLWKDNQAFDLNQLIDPNSGWTITQARDINNLGEIIGMGTHGGIYCGVLLIPNNLEILEPKTNDKWIAGEKDTIKWNGGKKNQWLQIDYSADSGSTFNVIDWIPNGDTGIYVWDIPADILSKKCLIRIVDMADPTIADTSEVFKIKGYILTRDSSGQYEPYRKEEDQWGFRNRRSDIFPQTWYQQFDYQGIDPFTGSQYSQWQCGNVFASSISAEFPDWVSWVNTFGINECYVSTLLGIYYPTALNKWDAVNRLWSGSCFGIAASNALAFSYKAQFQTKFPSFPAFVNPITVLSNDGVKKVVNELFTNQSGNPTVANDKLGFGKTPNQTLNELKQMLKEDEGQPKSLSIFNNGGSGGHTILAYRVRQDPVQKKFYYIDVYDNSKSASINPITIDTTGNGNNGTWSTPDWPGWGGNKKIYLEITADQYLNGATFPKRHRSAFILSDNVLEIDNPTESSIRIIDTQQNVTGYSNNIVYEEIPGSVVRTIKNGSETPPYGYSLPTDNYSVVVDNITSDTVKTFFFTGNKSFTYKRFDADQNQTDRFFFDGGVSVTNPDQQNKTISLLNIINETTQEKLFAFSTVELAQNDSVKIENPDSNKIKLISYGSAKDYDVELNYVTGNGIGRFGHYNIELTVNTSHTFIPDWENISSTQLTVLVDIGNDGTIDDTLNLNNTVDVEDEGSLLLPTEYNLAQNYPNPFNPVTTIRYSIPQRSKVVLKVYDVLGNEITILVNEEKEIGVYSVNFDASQLASGIYLYRLQAGSFVETKKMLVIR